MFKKLFEMIKEQNTVKAKCSNCSADTEIDITKPVATCQYCGGGFENPYYEKHLKRQAEQQKQEDFEDNSFFEEEDSFGFDDNFEDEYEDDGLYAVIEKSALFFEGEIPGITFGSARLCKSYGECVNKLKEIANKERRGAFYEKPHQNLREIRREHPNGKIIKV